MADTNMAEVVERCANIDIEDEDEDSIILEASSVQKQALDLRWAFVGRFLTDKEVKEEFMAPVMASVWRPGRGVWIQQQDYNVFVFQFQHEVDIKRVMEGGPWNFENHVLIMERIWPGDDPMKVALFDLNPWVQVHNLPVGFMSDFVAKRIAEKIGKHVETDPNNFIGTERSYMRVRVGIDARKALKSSLSLKVNGGESVMVTLRYERLPTFCYICGKIGHGEKFCPMQYESDKELCRHFGAELRAQNRRGPKLDGVEKWLRQTPVLWGSTEGVSGQNGEKLGGDKAKNSEENMGVDGGGDIGKSLGEGATMETENIGVQNKVGKKGEFANVGTKVSEEVDLVNGDP